MLDDTGQQLGNYRLLRLLWENADVSIYLGEQVPDQAQVLIKCPTHPDDTLAKIESVENFLADMQALVRLEHPNIAGVRNVGVEKGLPFVVLALPGGAIPGRINDILYEHYSRRTPPRDKPLPLATILPYVKQIATVLQYAHDQGAVFHDLEPDNILVTTDNQVLLSEGINFLKNFLMYADPLERDGAPVVVYYMAPESFLGKTLPASNQYSLGAMVQKWLYGRSPTDVFFWDGMLRIWDETDAWEDIFYRPPAIRPAIQIVLMTALAREPKYRFASVIAFANALERAYELERSTGRLSEEAGGEGDDAEILAPPPPPVPTSPLPPPYVPTSPLPVPSPPFPRPPVSSLPPEATLLPAATLFTYKGHSDSVHAVAWSPDGKHIASAGADGTVQVWPATGETTLFTYRGHTRPVHAVAWSPDGRRIASAGEDGTVQVWQWPAGPEESQEEAVLRIETRSYEGDENVVYAAAWSPDSTRIASAGTHRVEVWDATTGNRITAFWGHAWTHLPDGRLVFMSEPDLGGTTFYSAAVNALAWSPDGTRIASAGGPSVQVWNASTGGDTFIFRYDHDTVNAVAWSPSGRDIASASNTGTVQVWTPLPDATIGTFYHSSPVRALAWSPDGKRLAAVEKDEVHLWDVFDTVHERKLLYSGHSAPIRAVAWSPDGTRMASAGDDRTVQVWTIAARPKENVEAPLCIYHGHVGEAITWSPDDTRIASGGDKSNLDIWDAATGQHLLTYEGHDLNVVTIAWSPDGTRIASTEAWSQKVQVWDAMAGHHLLTYEGHCETGDVDDTDDASGPPTIGYFTLATWSPTDRRIASAAGMHGTKHPTIQVWDAVGGDSVATTGHTILTYSGHTSDINAIAWSPDGMRIASVSDDRLMHIWDAHTGERLFTLPRENMQGDGLAWSPDGKLLASAEGDCSVRVWDTTSGEAILTYRGHTHSVLALTWSSDGTRIASAASGDGVIQLWDATTGECTHTYRGLRDDPNHRNWICALAWSPEGTRIAGCFSGRQAVYVWQLP